MNSFLDSRKYKDLCTLLLEANGAVIAFSGGVDSVFLLHAAKSVLKDRVVAVTFSTPYIPEWELAEARQLACYCEAEHLVIEVPFLDELRLNPADHCYICKKYLFARLWEVAKEYDFAHVFDGTNVDDLSDFRPGLRALLELQIRSPFVEAAFCKQDIRRFSKILKLPTWNKPSFACLLSRFPVGLSAHGDDFKQIKSQTAAGGSFACSSPSIIHDSDLRRVEEAEVFLMDLGFKSVRVRNHGDTARIEVPLDKIADLVRDNMCFKIDLKLKELGYRHVSVDLGGYRTGSMNKLP